MRHLFAIQNELAVMHSVLHFIAILVLNRPQAIESLYDKIFCADSLLEAERPPLQHLALLVILDIEQGQRI